MTGCPAIEDLTGRPFATVPQLWAARVQRSPDAPFLIWEGRTSTFREAWRAIEQLAAVLTEQTGLQPGQRVCGFLSNTPGALWTWFATLRADGSYVPINRALKGALLEERLRASRADLLITDPAGRDELASEHLAGFRAVAVVDGDKLTIVKQPPKTGHERPLLCVAALRDDPLNEAGVIGTSGSTGSSKTVRLAHAALTHGAARVCAAWQITQADTFHGWLPHFHVAGQINQVLPAIVAGCRLALYPTFSASRFWQQVHESAATIVIGLPNVVHILWQRPPDPAGDRSTLRLWVTGAMDRTIHDAFEQRFGVQVLEQYGMTEAELITLPRFGERFPLGSCGRAGPDWELCIADDNDCPLPPYATGQILVRPRQPGILMLGYDGDEAATAAALRNAWFHCGDFGYVDDEGFLYFVERRKYVIRRRGENIASSDIERIVASHPAVAECAAIGVPSELGEEDVKLLVQLKPGHVIDVATLHEHCVAHLARFMVPRYIDIVSELPHTPVGKIDKEQLRQRASRGN